MDAYRGALDNDINQYSGIAQRRGMNPQYVIPVLSPIADVPDPSKSTNTGAPVQIKGLDDYQALKPGTVYITPNGVQKTKH